MGDVTRLSVETRCLASLNALRLSKPRVSQCLASLEASRLSMPRVSRSLASLDASRLSMHRVSQCIASLRQKTECIMHFLLKKDNTFSKQNDLNRSRFASKPNTFSTASIRA